MQPEERGPDPVQMARTGAGLFAIVVMAYGFTFKPFLHDRFGKRGFGMPALVTLFLFPLHACLWTMHDPRPLIQFGWLYVIALFIQALRKQGVGVHSRYDGRPLLLALFPRMDETNCKLFWEPFLLVVTGIGVAPLNLPFGTYLIVSGFCLRMSYDIWRDREKAELMEMQDQMIELERRREQFESLRRQM